MPDGPRALEREEWDQLDEVVSTVFRPQMFRDYPQLFNEANRPNLRVVAEDGKVVCHVGMTERAASLGGCRIDVCCIGAVATYTAYRGRGFASLAFQDCCDKAAADGVDVMLISGGRGLYTRVGCRQVGDDREFAITADAANYVKEAVGAPHLGAPVLLGGGGQVPEDATLESLRRLYERETPRFLRPLEDWRMAFECEIVMNTASDFWGIPFAGGGALAAYVIVHQPQKVRRRNPGDPTVARVVEFAGDRTAVAAALPWLREHYGVDRATIHVQGSDPVLGALLSQSAGIQGTPSGASGTLRVINFRQLMERCRPLLAERIGGAAAGELIFTSDERPGSALGGFTIRRGQDAVRIPDLATLAQYLFGAPRPLEAQPEGPAELVALLSRALPLPSLWYGITYV